MAGVPEIEPPLESPGGTQGAEQTPDFFSRIGQAHDDQRVDFHPSPRPVIFGITRDFCLDDAWHSFDASASNAHTAIHPPQCESGAGSVWEEAGTLRKV